MQPDDKLFHAKQNTREGLRGQQNSHRSISPTVKFRRKPRAVNAKTSEIQDIRGARFKCATIDPSKYVQIQMKKR
jgi:hypothetical protein